MLKSRLSRFLLILAVVAVLIFIFLPRGGLGGDINYWIHWTGYIRQYGIENIYAVREPGYFPVNYFPIYIYILGFMHWLFSNPDQLLNNIHFVKYLIFLFDLAAVLLVGIFLNRRRISPYWAFILLLNPAIWYNSLFWGQIESIYIFFSLGAVLAAVKGKTLPSIILYVLAFYSKLQAIVFLPLLVILLLPRLRLNIRNWLSMFAVAILTHLVITWPYMGKITEMYKNVLLSVDLFPVVSANAYNSWVFLVGPANVGTTDAATFLGLSYKMWGLGMFCLISAIAMLPIFLDLLKKRDWDNQKMIYKLMLVLAAVSLGFFYFNTQMHERYLQPAVIFLGIALIMNFRYRLLALYSLLSVAYVLHLEKVGRLLNLADYQLPIFSSRLLAVIFGLCLIWIIIEIYKTHRQ